jgi:hypothetical protein
MMSFSLGIAAFYAATGFLSAAERRRVVYV